MVPPFRGIFRTEKNDRMNASTESNEMVAEEPPTLDLEPDVVALGEYLAKKRGMTFSQFVEYLITKEAVKGK
jgi:hypothetical protein